LFDGNKCTHIKDLKPGYKIEYKNIFVTSNTKISEKENVYSF